MNEKIYSTIDCVRLLGIAEHRLAYAYRIGKLPEPDRVAGKRIYRKKDMKEIAAYFNVPLPKREAADA